MVGENNPPSALSGGRQADGKSVHKYLLRRVMVIIPTLLGISMVLFSILALAPGDPFEELALNPNIPAEVRCTCGNNSAWTTLYPCAMCAG